MWAFPRFPHFFRAAAAVLVCTVSLPAFAETAAPPYIKTQAPGYYRMMLGGMEVVALYDGYSVIPTRILKGIDEKSAQSLLSRMFIETNPGVQTAVNAFLINTGRNLVLVDAGTARCFTPSLGHVVENIRASGYRPEQVDTILLTHLHPDHVCGLTREGKAVFPRAAVYASQYETDYWLNAELAEKVDDKHRPSFKMAQDAVAPYQAAGRFRSYGMDETLVPGVSIVATPGHTPGHTSYLFTDGTHRLLIWGDIVHSHAVQFDYPDVSLEFDVDGAQAIATRKKIFVHTAKEALWVGGAHLPFPGLGHVSYNGERYRWVPVEYGPVEADRR